MTPVGGLPTASVRRQQRQRGHRRPVRVGAQHERLRATTAADDPSAAGDPSNVDNFTASETIPEWRLVPNDNNIGQRNVTVLPGGGGMEALRQRSTARRSSPATT